MTTVPLPTTDVAAIDPASIVAKLKLGAALAAPDLAEKAESLVAPLTSFGQAAEAARDKLSLVYQHVGAPAVFTAQNGTIVDDHAMETYLGALGAASDSTATGGTG